MLQEAELIDRLCRSTVYQDFERSFCEVTQFPLRLSPPENRSLAGNGQVDGQQFSSATDVPVRLGDKIIGLLQLGRPALEARVEHFKALGKPQRLYRFRWFLSIALRFDGVSIRIVCKSTRLPCQRNPDSTSRTGTVPRAHGQSLYIKPSNRGFQFIRCGQGDPCQPFLPLQNFQKGDWTHLHRVSESA